MLQLARRSPYRFRVSIDDGGSSGSQVALPLAMLGARHAGQEEDSSQGTKCVAAILQGTDQAFHGERLLS